MLDFATAKACFNSLLQTANNASFLRFPFATMLSYKAFQALLYLHALVNRLSKIRSIAFLLLLISILV